MRIFTNHVRISEGVQIFFIALILLKLALFGVAFYSFEVGGTKNNKQVIEASNTQLIGDISLYAQKISVHDLPAYSNLQTSSQQLINQLGILKHGGLLENNNQIIASDKVHTTLLGYMMQLSKEIQRDGDLLYRLSFRADSLGHQYLRSDINYAKQAFFLQKIAENTSNLRMSNQQLMTSYKQKRIDNEKVKRTAIVLFFVISFIITILIYRWVIKQLVLPIQRTKQLSEGLINGNLNLNFNSLPQDEIGHIIRNLELFTQQLSQATNFATEIGQGNFETSFESASQDDRLGKALLEMRENLKISTQTDRVRRRANEGIALFNDLLNNIPENEQEFGYQMISTLVKFLEANQGGFYVLEEEEENLFLSLTAHYAYNKRKYLTQRIPVGTDILGQTVQEKQTIVTKNVPQNYILITSGLGEATPSHLLAVPLVHNGKVFGVLELASFQLFKPYEVEFVERISENIASVLATVRNNQRMNNLLEESQMYFEQLTAQEEELRMNLEEFTATQEESMKKLQETSSKLKILEQIQNTSQDFVLVLDKDYCLVYMNQAFCEAYQAGGIQPYIGMKVLSLFPESDREAQIQRYSQAFEGKKVRIRHRIQEAQPETIYFETDYQRISDKAVVVISRNITHLRPTDWQKEFPETTDKT